MTWIYNPWSETWHNLDYIRYVNVSNDGPPFTVKAVQDDNYETNLFIGNTREEALKYMLQIMVQNETV